MALPTRYKGSAAYLSIGLTEADQVADSYTDPKPHHHS